MKSIIKQILFPTDFSENARKALCFAADLAKRADAKLIILHVIEEHYEFAPLPEDVKSRIHRKAKFLLQDTKEGIIEDSRYSDLEVETVILNGNTVFSILEEIENNPRINLIAMSTHGATGLKRLILGSNTADVLLHSKIPILVIPEQFHQKAPSRFIYATNYQEKDIQAISMVAEWAKLYDVTVNVVHVADDHSLENEIRFRGFRELCKERIDNNKLGFDLITEGDFFAGITSYLEQKPDSIVTMTHYTDVADGFLSTLFRKSQTKDFSFYTKVPLLVLSGIDNY